MVVELEVGQDVADERAALARVDDDVLRALVGVDEREETCLLVGSVYQLITEVQILFTKWAIGTLYQTIR